LGDLTFRGTGPLLCQIGAQGAENYRWQRAAGGGPDARVGVLDDGRFGLLRSGRLIEAASQATLETVSLFGGKPGGLQAIAGVHP
jgi:hypothetical protein